MSTICKTCGATVSDDETHCPYCDSPIEKPITYRPERQPSDYYNPYDSNSASSQIESSTNKIQGGKFWGLVILSFLFPIAGWILYFVYKNDDHDAAKAFSIWAWFGLAFAICIQWLN